MNSTLKTIPAPKKVLIVDDNKIYRDAFRRNLMLRNCTVVEAENAEDALQKIREEQPDIVITDLQMRTEKEGLELIQQIKSNYPLLPVIMISAVGTFEEGAQAQQLGAHTVISKSAIEKEIEHLYSALENAYHALQRDREHEAILQAARMAASGGTAPDPALVEQLRGLLTGPAVHPYIRQEAFNIYLELDEQALKSKAQQAAVAAGLATPASIEEIEQSLKEEMESYLTFDADTRDTLRTAEFLFRHSSEQLPAPVDFTRNIGFSYCFAVENEVKSRLHKRLQKLLGSETTYSLITEMLEPNRQSVSVYYQQYILRLLRGYEWDITIDNLCQTFRRMLEHQARYKPDGLKALGIIVLVFGRDYSWSKMDPNKRKREVRVANPLNVRGLADDAELMRFVELLVKLQHFRNPYIHPEISELEKISVIRKSAFECLMLASKIT